MLAQESLEGFDPKTEFSQSKLGPTRLGWPTTAATDPELGLYGHAQFVYRPALRDRLVGERLTAPQRFDTAQDVDMSEGKIWSLLAKRRYFLPIEARGEFTRAIRRLLRHTDLLGQLAEFVLTIGGALRANLLNPGSQIEQGEQLVRCPTIPNVLRLAFGPGDVWSATHALRF